MASKRGPSLEERLAEAKMKHDLGIEGMFFTIDEKCKQFEEQISQKQNNIQKLEDDYFAQIQGFSSQLEHERQARNGTDALKSSRGRLIGTQYCESLKTVEATAQGKLSQLQVEIKEANEKLAAFYQAFKSKYEELTRNTPDEYLKGAMESKQYFDAKKQGLEQSLQAAETLIQQEYRTATESRVETATSLENHLQERRTQIESYRRNVKQTLELTKTNLQRRLREVAQTLGIDNGS